MSDGIIGPTQKRNLPERIRLFLRGCVSSHLNIALTLVVLSAAAWALPGLIRWSFTDAVWSGTSGKDCAGHDGACWIFLRARAEQLLFGTYPAAERWRVGAAALIGVAAPVMLVTWRRLLALPIIGAILIGCAAAIGILLYGGLFGLPVVPTNRWGGAILTVIIAAWAIATALPLGLALALARRSELPVVSSIAAGFIDLVRSLPLIGILFLMIVMFPLFVPAGVETDKLLRVLIAFTVYNAANFAEVFRGGLQAIPHGQTEAGWGLGLSKWRATALIVIPQAIAISVPAAVNLCIAIIKETTIVVILGLFDFVGVLQAGIADPDWLMAESVRTTSYVFAALVFWVVCFGLSRYSLTLEKRNPLSIARNAALVD